MHALRRLTWTTLVLLLAPTVLAGTPASNLTSAFSLGGQDLLDLAMDPSGEYVVAVVPVDATSVVSGVTPAQSRKDDIYPCHFGAPGSTNAGSGCRSPGLQHSSTRRATQLSPRQAVDYTSFRADGRLSALYAVAGPSDTLSLWSSIEDLPRWEITVPGGQTVSNVSLSHDAKRILVGTAPQSGSSGRFMMYNASATSPSLLWEFELTSTRPTTMDYARTAAVAVVGASPTTTTNSGEVILFQPSDRKPSQGTTLYRYDVGSAQVNDVLLTPDGRAGVAATSQHVFFFAIDPQKAEAIGSQRWSRQVSTGCQAVALAHDASVFAAACGSQVRFFKYLGGDLVAQDVGTFDAGAPVADLAYDASGSILVAVAGNVVYGFGPGRATPIWQFTATDTAHGALDGPLRKVVVSESGERIVVGGKTKVMPYRSIVAASGVFVQPQRMEVQPATTTRLALTVTNTGSMSDNYSFSAIFPPGWNGFSPDPVRLHPEESATVNFTVEIPPGQSPGFYGVAVDVRSETLQRLGRDRVVVASPTLNLTVPRSVVLNVTVSDERVPALRPGGEVTVPVTVRNRGNAEGIVNLSTTQALSRGAPWTLRFQSEQITIPPGGEQTVSLVLSAPADAASGDRNDITICARESEQRTCTKDPSLHYEATRVITAYVDPRFGAELTTNTTSFEFGPGQLRVVSVTILNNGNTDDEYNLTATITPTSVQNDWTVTLERDFIKIPRGEKRSVTVTVRAAGSDPRDATLIVRAISIGSVLTEDSTLSLSLVPRPPTAPTDDRLLPFPSLLALLGLVAAVATLRRRGGGRS